MNKNFKIEDSIAIRATNEYIDLHNYYTFLGFNILIPKNEITLKWEKSEKFQLEQGLASIEIIFENIAFFEMSDGFCVNFPTNVEEIGYKEKSDFDLDWLNSEEQSEPDYHIFFRFRGDHFLRIYAENIIYKGVE